jgi:hypothetical protein
VKARADELVGLLAGRGSYDALFTPVFRAQIGADQFAAVTRSLVAALGAPVRVDSIAAPTRWRVELVITFEHGTATMQMALESAEPHAITELRVISQAARGDTLGAIESSVRALPGTAAIGVYALGPGEPRPLLEVHGDAPTPLGSAFKLWVLAEAARQVAAGTHRWRDVVAVGPPSLASGLLQSWPRGAPVTLQTLATLMISISDNTATDTLMRLLGRAAVDRAAAASGLTTPVLTTREAFVLKGDPALRTRWTALAPPARAALLARDSARFDATPLATGVFGNGPVATDTVEWFASPRAVASLLDRLRRNPDPVVRDILAINAGVDPATAGRFAYLGYKGGSEPGVLTLNVVAKTRAGIWFAVTGAWHRPDGATSEAELGAIVTRALSLVADR